MAAARVASASAATSAGAEAASASRAGTADALPTPAARLPVTNGRDKFVYVWLELMQTQCDAMKAATAACGAGKTSTPNTKLQAVLKAQQRVAVLQAEANEMLYMHILPAARDPVPPSAKRQGTREASTGTSECCVHCSKRVRQSGVDPDDESSRQNEDMGSVSGVSDRQKRETGVTSDSPDLSVEGADRGGQRRPNADVETGQGRRHMRQEGERPTAESLDDGEDLCATRLHDALMANRIRGALAQMTGVTELTNPTLASTTAAVSGEPGTPRPSQAQPPSTPTGGRSSVLAPSQLQQPPSASTPPSTGKKRKRKSSSGSSNSSNGERRLSRSAAAKLTAEKVLGCRWNDNVKEYRIKWTQFEEPAWITRRKCSPQAGELIDAYSKRQRNKKKNAKRREMKEGSDAVDSAVDASGSGIHGNTRPNDVAKETPSDSSSSEDEGNMFTVDKLMADRKKCKRRQYLVRWDGYDSSEDTWEYADDLRKYVPEIVDEYEAQRKLRQQELRPRDGGETNARPEVALTQRAPSSELKHQDWTDDYNGVGGHSEPSAFLSGSVVSNHQSQSNHGTVGTVEGRAIPRMPEFDRDGWVQADRNVEDVDAIRVRSDPPALGTFGHQHKTSEASSNAVQPTAERSTTRAGSGASGSQAVTNSSATNAVQPLADQVTLGVASSSASAGDKIVAQQTGAALSTPGVRGRKLGALTHESEFDRADDDDEDDDDDDEDYEDDEQMSSDFEGDDKVHRHRFPLKIPKFTSTVADVGGKKDTDDDDANSEDSDAEMLRRLNG